jgi:hypothetical protein
MEKKNYSGLTTKRVKVACQPIMAVSDSKMKVKTTTVNGTDEWVEDNNAGSLQTSISSEL